MNNSDPFNSPYNVPGLGLYGLGTGILVNYPQTRFKWSFYTSATTGSEGALPNLWTHLTDSKIGFNQRSYGIAPGSNPTRPGNIQISNFNHARAVEAEVRRIRAEYGSSIRGRMAQTLAPATSGAPPAELAYPAKVTLLQDWIEVDGRHEKIRPACGCRPRSRPAIAG